MTADHTGNAFRALLERYRATLPDKIRELDGALKAYQADEADGRQALKVCAHRLAGSASSYGYDDLSLAAARLDDGLAGALLLALKEASAR
jgi:HPt (histidine-containing phosphotransfer) domain-containing protein